MRLVKIKREFYLLNDESVTVGDIFFDKEAGTINILAVQQTGTFWINNTNKVIASTQYHEGLSLLNKDEIYQVICRLNLEHLAKDILIKNDWKPKGASFSETQNMLIDFYEQTIKNDPSVKYIDENSWDVVIEMREVCSKGCINLVLNGEKSVCCGRTTFEPYVTENGYINIVKIKY